MHKLKEWLKRTIYKDFKITIASTDASFRKYYRLKKDEKRYILMDSSLELDSLKPFYNVTSRLLNANVKVPNIYLKDEKLGYLVIEDFGDVNLLNLLNRDTFKEFYLKAIDEIIKMQNADTKKLPLYDEGFLHFEMDLMREWYLEKKLNLHLTFSQLKMIKSSLNDISRVVLSQIQNVFVHRDFHSRNIMITPSKEIGVIDYQDAMNGAITYDLVSLLKDCYIKFDREDIENLALNFRDKKKLDVSDKEFLKWFDFMGLQRHIKVLGIFSRLYLRDKKDNYLKDIPLVLEYITKTAFRYEETKELAKFLEKVAT